MIGIECEDVHDSKAMLEDTETMDIQEERYSTLGLENELEETGSLTSASPSHSVRGHDAYSMTSATYCLISTNVNGERKRNQSDSRNICLRNCTGSSLSRSCI